jgi:hypothetical protein
MSDTLLRVDVEGLQEAIDNANEINWSDLTEALGEGLTRFKDRLRGTGQRPGNPWPIGTRKRSAKGNDYYVPLGTPGGRRSGRSLRGWKARQRGISAVAFNDARDKRGNYYAEFVHLKDKDSGSAVEEAFEIFAEEMDTVSQEMIASLMRDLDGG